MSEQQEQTRRDVDLAIARWMDANEPYVGDQEGAHILDLCDRVFLLVERKTDALQSRCERMEAALRIIAQGKCDCDMETGVLCISCYADKALAGRGSPNV